MEKPVIKFAVKTWTEMCKARFRSISLNKSKVLKSLESLCGKKCGVIHWPANIYLFKVHNRKISKRCKICLKFTIKTPERFLLLTFNIFHNFF